MKCRLAKKVTGGEKSNVQGDTNQNLLFQMVITLKLCISDPRLVKPKCVLGAYVYFWKL